MPTNFTGTIGLIGKTLRYYGDDNDVGDTKEKDSRYSWMKSSHLWQSCPSLNYIIAPEPTSAAATQLQTATGVAIDPDWILRGIDLKEILWRAECSSHSLVVVGAERYIDPTVSQNPH